jgi:hypothetical protein
MALSHCFVLLAITSLLGASAALGCSHHGRHGFHAKRSQHGTQHCHGIWSLNYTQGWLSGSATFYGLPTASGPPDNGNTHNAMFYMYISYITIYS